MGVLEDIEWWVKFRSPWEIYKLHPSFIKMEIMYYCCALLTLIHAVRNGGRYKWLWIGSIMHGLTTELVSYFLPDIDNFWHAQGMVMFVGQRLPLYIVLIYAVFIYTASVAVSHLKLSWWAEPFAVGLTVVAIDLPYDILAVKHLCWTWHDTDPNIYDRNYWAPWTSYYFHSAFAAGFTFMFHGVHRLLGGDKNQFKSKGFWKELPNLIMAGTLGFPVGVLQFLPNYHIFHDKFHIHTEVCYLAFAAVFAMIIWRGDRMASIERAANNDKNNHILNEITLLALLHYGFFMYLVFANKPEDNRVYGLHETPGPCNETVPMVAASGQILHKRKYLCLEDYNEGYFDFHCLDKLPAHGESWYTVCGTPYPNHMEYIYVIYAVCLFGLHWIFSLVASGALPSIDAAKRRDTKLKQN